MASVGKPTAQSTLALLLGINKRRPGEFIPLSEITNALDNKERRSEPTRTRGTPSIIDDDGSIERRAADFNASPEILPHAVRALMFGYALVSAAGAPCAEWRNI